MDAVAIGIVLEVAESFEVDWLVLSMTELEGARDDDIAMETVVLTMD